jgi:endonuclease YncB( thermonuclease family)
MSENDRKERKERKERKYKASELEELKKIQLNDHPKYAITGKFIAQVVKVYDGDTITIVMRANPKAPYYQYNVRMYGYDSPELRPPKSLSDEERVKEIEAAKMARDYLRELILNDPVLVDVLPDNDKYGRLLCNVYMHLDINAAIAEGNKLRDSDFSICVNNRMLEEKHGYEYYGGTKK